MKKMPLRGCKGYTLIEILVVVSLLLIVLGATYNLLFYSFFTTKKIQEESLLYIEGQTFYYKLEKEIKQARKAEENEPVLKGENHFEEGYSTMTIYTDINGDGKPEKVKYEVEGTNLVRSYKIRDSKGKNGDEYPYKYTTPYEGKKILLDNIASPDIFKNIKKVHKDNESDHRKSVEVEISRYTLGKEGQKLDFKGYIITRSRAESD